jgi:hypothetical protein
MTAEIKTEIRQVAIADATGPQLRAFAGSHLGIEFGQFDKVADIRAKVRQAWDKDTIPVPEDPPAAGATAGPGVDPEQAAKPAKPEKVKIIIAATEEAGGDEPVQVSVNGRAMLIQRGEEVEIPYPYFEVLQNAVMYRYEPLKDGGIGRPRSVQMYPFQRVA